MLKINNQYFTFQIASDVIRDGIGVELWERKDGQDIHLAEIFRNDSKRQVEVFANVQNLPFEVLQELIQVFLTEIPAEYQE